MMENMENKDDLSTTRQKAILSRFSSMAVFVRWYARLAVLIPLIVWEGNEIHQIIFAHGLAAVLFSCVMISAPLAMCLIAVSGYLLVKSLLPKVPDGEAISLAIACFGSTVIWISFMVMIRLRF